MPNEQTGTQEPPERRRLFRSASERKIAGVCGGIAAYLDVDPTVIRLAWVVLTIATGVLPGILAYLVAIWVMPVAPDQAE